ncbi:MAG: PIN domain-containing protein [Deltaproteobacteria bacterium]|nr:PIN domain-containing protein [Deltaproteobacteria bacterium]
MEKQQVVPWIYFSLSTIMAYLGLVIGSKKIEESSFFGFLSASGSEDKKLLDTSVIIDGRIVDICKTGFLEGKLLLPKFVIDELQHIADSSDSLRRSRGRRGLDMLNQMKREAMISLEVIDQDVPKIKSVDGKLVALAKEIGAKIITNDFNLNKVAELQGVKALNLNELAGALKPVVLPGEALRVQVIKEGKETGQGVGYLDDGTMVVVDGGYRLIGSTTIATVTSIIQTAAGRMIFAEAIENHHT